MPKSDTWPGGITMETMAGMDSAGSCDSVVSMNSGSSDDSLEHLSAEEKACLMFLEETIESLDTEEDSGLSNDEPDRLPAPGNVANKTAHLSASMDNNKLNKVCKLPCEQPIGEAGKERKPAFGYLVPTPLVLAKGSSGLLPKTRPGLTPDKENSRPGLKAPSSEPKPRQSHPRIPSEVNVVVIPPPAKPRDPPGCWGSEGGASSRGPLSYEALVQLRKSASMKRTPEGPPAEATRDWSKQPSGLAVSTKAHPCSHPSGPSATRLQDPSRYNPSLPIVAPKPKRMPSNVSIKPQSEAAAYSPPLDSSPSDRPPSDPQRVRKEALQKLGLLRQNGPEPRSAASTSPSKSHSSWDNIPPFGLLKDPSINNPGRGQPFSYTQAPGAPHNKPRPVQSSGSFLLHNPTQTAAPSSHPVGPKAATLERSGVGLGSHAADQATQSVPQPRSGSLGSQRRDGYGPPAAPSKAPETVPTAAPLAQPAAQKPAQAVGFSVVMVPSMGEDRREALRKLGLLKN